MEQRPGFFHRQDPQTSFTLLNEALRRGSLPALEVLIGYGADVSAINEAGSTLLRFAAQYHQTNEEHASLLMDHGIDIHYQDGLGNTALMYAVGAQKVALVELLIRRGTDLDARGQLGLTAVMRAILMGGFRAHSAAYRVRGLTIT